jgi:myo-inositol 2-dehydrogenase / D-chiro-inositol 1-dehydrogenase
MNDRSGVPSGSGAATPAIRLAVVGAGRMGARHAQASIGVQNAGLSWVIDPDLPRAERLAATYGARATADLDEALDSGDVDAVIVATPTPTHRQIAERGRLRQARPL